MQQATPGGPLCQDRDGQQYPMRAEIGITALISATTETTLTTQANNPLHGITLEHMLVRLEKELGWAEMAKAVPINCFCHEPSVKSSLKFLRRTPWARQKVERLYLNAFHVWGAKR